MFETCRIKAFIFDLDGTLIDSVDAHVKSWVYALKFVGLKDVNEDDIRKLVGLSGSDILMRLFGKGILKLYSRIRWIKDRVFLKELRVGRVTLYPGALKLLKLLKGMGYSVAIASSTPNYLLMHICDYLGISNIADLMIGGDEVTRGKPNPDLFIHTISKLNLKPVEVAIVGDTVYDIEPANRLNAVSILVNNPKLPENPRPKYYFRHIYELLVYVRGNITKC